MKIKLTSRHNAMMMVKKVNIDSCYLCLSFSIQGWKNHFKKLLHYRRFLSQDENVGMLNCRCFKTRKSNMLQENISKTCQCQMFYQPCNSSSLYAVGKAFTLLSCYKHKNHSFSICNLHSTPLKPSRL